MDFDEAKAACDQIVILGEKLLEYPSPEAARELEQACAYQRAQMRGRFGNVGEQLTRTITAAKRYQKSRVDVTSANAELHSALAAKHPWTTIVCDSSSMSGDLDLRMKPRDPNASIHIILTDVKCPRCNGHGRPRIVRRAQRSN